MAGRSRIATLLAALAVVAALAAGCTSSEGSTPSARRTKPEAKLNAASVATTPAGIVRERLAQAAEAAAQDTTRPVPPGRVVPASAPPASAADIVAACDQPATVSEPPADTILVSHQNGTGLFPLMQGFDLLGCYFPLLFSGPLTGIKLAPGLTLRCSVWSGDGKLQREQWIGWDNVKDPKALANCTEDSVLGTTFVMHWDVRRSIDLLLETKRCDHCDFAGETWNAVELDDNVRITHSRFTDNTFTDVHLVGWDVEDSTFDNSVIASSVLASSRFANTTFHGVQVSDTNFLASTFDHVDFSPAAGKASALIRTKLPSYMGDVRFDDTRFNTVSVGVESNDGTKPTGQFGCMSYKNLVLDGPVGLQVADAYGPLISTHAKQHLDGTPADPAACQDAFAGAIIAAEWIPRLYPSNLSRSYVIVPSGGTDVFVNAEMPGLLLDDVAFVGGPEPSFGGANLAGASLHGLRQPQGRFNGVSLASSTPVLDRKGAVLVPARPTAPRPTDLGGAHLQKANLRGAFLDGVNLSGADLSGAVLDGANLANAQLNGVTAQSTAGTASLRQVYAPNANFAGFIGNSVHLDGSHIYRTQGDQPSFEKAQLADAVLTGAVLSGANFTTADLTSAHLDGIVCLACDFTGANLASADLRNSLQIGSTFAQLATTTSLELQGMTATTYTAAITLPLADQEAVSSNPVPEVPPVDAFPFDAVGAANSCPDGSGPDVKAGCTGTQRTPKRTVKLPTCSAAGTFRCPAKIDAWPTGGSSTIRDVAQSAVHEEWRLAIDATAGSVLLLEDDGKGTWAARKLDAAGVQDAVAVSAMPDGGFAIADAGARRILRVDLAGAPGDASVSATVTVLAGTGATGDAGDGGPAAAATFTTPAGVWVDPSGATYVSDTDTKRVRRIDPDGTIHHVSTGGLQAPGRLSGDGLGSVYVVDTAQAGLFVIDGISAARAVAGAPATATPAGPKCLASTRACTPDQIVFGELTDVEVVPITTGSTTVGGSALVSPVTVLIADRATHMVYAFTPGEKVRKRYVGTGTAGDSGDGGPASAAELAGPEAIAADAGADTLFVVDTSGSTARVRVVTFPPS